MKKFFAKYLPVEGSIRKGDYYIANDGKPTLALVEADYHQWLKRAELSLCSRDIKVGDDYYKNGRDITLFGIYSEPTDKCFKKIGKVSPDATWVKEGDEFDEGELLQQGIGVNLTTNGGWVTVKCKCCGTAK